MKVSQFVFLIGLIFVAATQTFGQLSESAALQLARKSKCVQELSPRNPDFVRALRREDIEDELFQLRDERLRPFVKPAYFLEFTVDGVFITETGEVVESVSNGFAPKIIAVSKTGMVFPLFGCQENSDSFKDLVNDAKIRLDTSFKAEIFARLYYRLTDDIELTRLVFTSRQFKHLVEDFYYSNFQEKVAEKKFDHWLRANPLKDINSQELGVTSGVKNQGFLVTLTSAEIFSKQVPALRRMEMLVDESGHFEDRPNVYPLRTARRSR